ncbi:MAG: ribonuclease HIII [Akkermansia sp.]
MTSPLIFLLTDEQVHSLQLLLDAKGYETKSVPYSQYSYKAPGLSVTVYEKQNKLMLQGKNAAEFIEFTLEPEILGQSMFDRFSEQQEVSDDTQVQNINTIAGMKRGEFSPHFGIDESGKGDYFGPLVIAGVYTDEMIAKALIKIGVCDSKLVSNSSQIRRLAAGIRSTPGVAYQIVSIGPERYNEMYASFRNLNHLLAWGHTRVIEGLLEKVPACPRSLSDQFAHASVLKRALAQKKLTIQLDQRTKAESDVAVAAASILARERFVNWMDEASTAGKVKLPLGASKQVVTAGREFIRVHGVDMLDKVAKLHFKTTQQVCPDLLP